MDTKTKTCSKCKETKDLAAFYFDKRRGKLSNPCKDCHKLIVASSNHKWRKEHPEITKRCSQESKLRSKYGLELKTLQAILKDQQGVCVICEVSLSFSAQDKRYKPHVDHDHVTGEVRGLLCLTCNTGLGMFGDSTDLLDAAKDYLLRRVTLTVVEPTDSALVSAEYLSQYKSDIGH